MRHQHLLRRLADDRRFEEVSIVSLRTVELVAAHYDLATMLLGICNVRLGLVQASRRCHWPHGYTFGRAVPNLNIFGLLRENLGEFVVHTLLDVDAIRCDTGLAGVAPFEGEEFYTTLSACLMDFTMYKTLTSCCLFEICIVED